MPRISCLLVSHTVSPDPSDNRRVPWWLWPHVLSLEAPLAAVLWQMLLGHVHRIALMPGTTLGLALAVWLVYLVDRLFDGWNTGENSTDIRHAFYARHAKLIGLVVIPLVMIALGGIALYRIPEGLLWECSALALLIAIYVACFPARKHRRLVGVLGGLAGLAVITGIFALPTDPRTKLQFTMIGFVMMLFGFLHRLDGHGVIRLPKELLGSLLFALGSSAGVQFFSMREGFAAASMDVLLLWMLFAMNMFGIARVEREAGNDDEQSVATIWPGMSRAYPILVLLCLGVCSFIMLSPASFAARAGELASSVAISLILLMLLWLGRSRLSPLSYRVLADYVLVVPALRMLL